MRKFTMTLTLLITSASHSPSSADQIPDSIPLPYTTVNLSNCDNCYDVGGYKTRIDCNKVEIPEGAYEKNKQFNKFMFIKNQYLLRESEPFLSKLSFTHSDDTARYILTFSCASPLTSSFAVSITRTTAYDDEGKAPSYSNVLEAIYGKYGRPNNEKIDGANSQLSYALGPDFYEKTSVESKLLYNEMPSPSPDSSYAASIFKSGVAMSLTFTMKSCLGEADRVCALYSRLNDYRAFLVGQRGITNEQSKWQPRIDQFIEQQRNSNQTKAPKL